MQETNEEHRKQERNEISSQVSATVHIEHAWKYSMNSGQSKEPEALQQLNKELWE